MFSTLNNRFGIPGVISVIALVFAMAGGAFAANHIASGGASASGKAKQGKQGKPGKTGPAGPAGPAGAAGAAGPKGDAGSNGSNGTNGTSATTESFNGALHGCTEGGVVVKSASPEAVVCNGKKGSNATGGLPEMLPSGKTETGAWAFGEIPASALPETLRIPISFTIPLEEELQSTQVHYINAAGKEVVSPGVEETSTKCLGSAAAPSAVAGNLCVYTGNLHEAKFNNGRIQKAAAGPGSPGASTAGSSLIVSEPEEEAAGNGTWAVTAE